MKKLTSQHMVIALFVAVAVIGLSYNAVMNHRDQEAYANSMALLAAQEAAPTTTRTFVQDGVTWHEKCEKGFCWYATNPESLEGPTVRKGGSGGIPVVDVTAIRKIESQEQTSH
ncbi:hypothetical protein VQ574_20805 (plasmid) [Stutzerimonas frequens]|uniref:hypothetical protein n=1 Tax=Stutzerimonas frequens TaxID=2968969 RepID=UPI002DBFD00E|nr:hypothetical protein [Stutzerimonas frequens]WRW29380.1 hypothetical protein VQ574_20805 [Stutzerimonas frequens]